MAGPRQIDLSSEYGSGVATELIFHVPVEDGILNLSFEPEAGDAAVSAVIVREADPMADVQYAINAGGPAYVGTNGIRYAPDIYYDGGSTTLRVRDVAATLDDVLQHSFREGTFSYELPVENGSYQVELQFSESYYNFAEQREFDVRAEYHQAFGDLDVVGETGAKSVALEKTYEVVVADGSLSLRFIRDNKNAILAGYSAFFTPLNRELQNDVIERMKFEMKG